MEHTRQQLEKLTGSEDYKRFKANGTSRQKRENVKERETRSMVDILFSSEECEEGSGEAPATTANLSPTTTVKRQQHRSNLATTGVRRAFHSSV